MTSDIQYDKNLAFTRKKEYVTKLLEKLDVFKYFNKETVESWYKCNLGVPYNSYSEIPGKASLVIELIHCDMQCGYCNKTYLVNNINKDMLDESFKFISVLELLEKILTSKNTRNIVITGGEPYYEPKGIHTNMNEMNNKQFTLFLTYITHKINRLVKVNTNGSNYRIFYKMYESIKTGEYNIFIPDYFTIDIKCSRETYPILFNIDAIEPNYIIDSVFNSLNLLQSISKKKNGDKRINVEVTTPMIPNITTVDEIERLTHYIKEDTDWKLRHFIRKGKHLDPVFDRLYDLLDEEEYTLLEVARTKVPKADFVRDEKRF